MQRRLKGLNSVSKVNKNSSCKELTMKITSSISMAAIESIISRKVQVPQRRRARHGRRFSFSRRLVEKNPIADSNQSCKTIDPLQGNIQRVSIRRQTLIRGMKLAETEAMRMSIERNINRTSSRTKGFSKTRNTIKEAQSIETSC